MLAAARASASAWARAVMFSTCRSQSDWCHRMYAAVLVASATAEHRDDDGGVRAAGAGRFTGPSSPRWEGAA